MNISLSHIILPSSDKPQLIRFLTFVFDCEVKRLKDQDFLYIGQSSFLISEKIKKSNNDLFVLNADKETLGDLTQKVKLAFYKEGLEESIISKTDRELVFKDPSGNSWSFILNTTI